jgi:hydroxymethylglutaryl-CoA lyase
MSGERRDPIALPERVRIGDVTVRDGFQHEEKFISTDAKVFYAEELILAGIRRLEVTNYGNPHRMPQFRDAGEIIKRLRQSKKLERSKVDWNELEITAVSIRERGVDRAIELRQQGIGPDRLIMMVSTDEEHHYANSGATLPEYWKEAERCIRKARDAGIKICGTVSTIWGSPIIGPTRLDDAVTFARHWLEIGAHDIEHADHDGSATPRDVYRYFCMVLDALPNPDHHVAHFHVTRGWGLANVYAALQAGIEIHEGTLGGIGGQPANFLDDTPVEGTGAYYYRNPNCVGLACTEDMVVMMDEMGIDTGVNVDRILELGMLMEKTVGRRLRSEAILNGRVPKQPRASFRRSGLCERKKLLGETAGQVFP